MYDFFYRVYRVLGRYFIKYSLNPRPSSPPYITGDGFRNSADHVYDDLKTDLDPEHILQGHVVFVGDNNIKKFLTEVHPNIKVNYILVTHNGDEKIDEERIALIDDKIIRWYGINIFANHPKVTPIPLGIENQHYYHLGIPMIFNSVRRKTIEKKNKIFYGFTPGNNPEERQPALDALKRNPHAETITKWLNFLGYLNLLATYKFVASPPGSSVEGHRTWDALYIGIVPIVKSSITIDYFKSQGLPIWVVHDWNELDGVDEVALEQKFKDIRKDIDAPMPDGAGLEKIFLNYWVDKIKNHKD